MANDLTPDQARVLLAALRNELMGSPGEPLPPGWTASDDVDLAERLAEIAGVGDVSADTWQSAPDALRIVIEHQGLERERMMQRAGGVAHVMQRAGGRVVDHDQRLGTLWQIGWQGGSGTRFLDESYAPSEQRHDAHMSVLTNVPGYISSVKQAIAFTGGLSAHQVLREL